MEQDVADAHTGPLPSFRGLSLLELCGDRLMMPLRLRTQSPCNSLSLSLTRNSTKHWIFSFFHKPLCDTALCPYHSAHGTIRHICASRAHAAFCAQGHREGARWAVLTGSVAAEGVSPQSRHRSRVTLHTLRRPSSERDIMSLWEMQSELQDDTPAPERRPLGSDYSFFSVREGERRDYRVRDSDVFQYVRVRWPGEAVLKPISQWLSEFWKNTMFGMEPFSVYVLLLR